MRNGGQGWNEQARQTCTARTRLCNGWMDQPFCTPALSALYVWSLSLEPKGHRQHPHAVDTCSRVQALDTPPSRACGVSIYK